MTVVIQHWYDNLEVNEDGFGITLNFGDAPEALYVPYDAIKTFVDPSVEFGLRFETQDEGNNENKALIPAKILPNTNSSKSSNSIKTTEKIKDVKPADVVSLDSFRK